MSSKNTHFTEEDLEKFDWLTLRKDMDAALPIETFNEKFKRKFKENPFIPIGCAATTVALGYGIWCLKTGQKKMSQYMMRTRILAQGFTILAMVAGITITAQKNFKN